MIIPSLPRDGVFYINLIFSSKMATSKQEQLYNEIVEYYAYADRLISAIENSEHELAEKQFEIIEEVAGRLEDCADQLTTEFINFVKNGESQKVSDTVRESINAIMTKIEECKVRIVSLYQESERVHG